MLKHFHPIRRTAVILLFCSIWVSYIFGQTAPLPSRTAQVGFPYIRNYSQADFKGDDNFTQSQTWSIVRDQRGVYYFGYLIGLISYDGNTWQKTEIPNKLVRSLAIDEAGTVFVGGVNEFGYLAADDHGVMQYASLTDHLSVETENFRDIWATLATPEGIYFQSYYRLFRWDGNNIKSWRTEKSIHNIFAPNKQLFVKQKSGLQTLSGDSLVFVTGGKFFENIRIIAILPYPDGKLLIATREKGLFIYDSQSAPEKLPSTIDTFLRDDLGYHGTLLSDGNYAFATLNNGVAVIDSDGNLLYHLNKSSGLIDDRAYFVYPDRQGGFWVAMEKGISHIESPWPVSIFSEANGFSGSVLSIENYRNRMYVATNQGVYRSLDSGGRLAGTERFEEISALPALCQDLLSTQKGLIAASSARGVYVLHNNIGRRLYSGSAYSLYRPASNSKRIYAGLINGLISLYLNNNQQWVFERRFPEIDEQITAITEDPAGDLWLGTSKNGVIRLSFPQNISSAQSGVDSIQISRFGEANGLPGGIEISPYAINEKIFLNSQSGIFTYDNAGNHFHHDSTLHPDFNKEQRQIFRMAKDADNNLWLQNQKYEIIAAYPGKNGRYQLDATPFRRIPFSQINAIYPDEDGTVWFGGDNGLIRYDPEVKRNYQNDFPTLINAVTIGNDSSLLKGSNWLHLPRAFQFPYALNALTFEYAAPYFDNESANKFQHLLEGFAEDWSGWSSENKVNFTNLSEGDYRFRVRAKNVYGHLGEEAVFAFKIFPPWYRSWWAYLLYGILAFTAIGSVFKYRIRYLEEKAKELEGIIVERTAQIREQKNQLAEQAEQLKELDKLKSRFFANISHEFRTPLTLILGPIDNLRQRFTGQDDQHELGMMQRNGRRLLNLINQLLDLSRLEDGKMILEARPDDFLAFLRGQVFSFESLARQKGIALEYHSDKAENDALEMYFDPDKLDKVFVNILSNAFKFTPADGKISVAVDLSSAKTSPGEEADTVIVRISDTGPGIEAERLSLIFERFYTVDQSYTKKQRGTGIGLALAKEFLDLHHGEITAESTVGKGTTFIVSLPLGKAHLNDEEIVDYMSPDEMVAVDIAEIAPDVAEDEPIETSSPIADKDAPTLLIVEDNADMRNYIHNHLSNLYQISEAEDGREGLEKALAMMPDLIISDVMMPRMDGYQLCDALKKDARTSHVPVILLTAKSSSGSKIEGLELGADDYLVKPFVAKELLARVKNLIEQRQLLRQRFSKEIIQVAPSEITVTPVDERFLKKAIEIVEERMADEEFSVELLSREIGMSRMQLHRKLKALTDQSPSMFIRTLRLKRAAQLLQQHSGNISEVAYDVGFNNLSYFAKAFREQFGMLPKEYEKKMGK